MARVWLSKEDNEIRSGEDYIREGMLLGLVEGSVSAQEAQRFSNLLGLWPAQVGYRVAIFEPERDQTGELYRALKAMGALTVPRMGRVLALMPGDKAAPRLPGCGVGMGEAVGSLEALKDSYRGALNRLLGAPEACAAPLSEPVGRALRYLEEHFSDPDLSLKDLARQAALSDNHFCTVFAQEVGQTFVEYLTALRMRRACRLLKQTSLLTSEVGYRVGYNDPHYFSALFKRRMGISPRAYRRRSEGEEPGERLG